MKVMRIVVPAACEYSIQQLSRHAGVNFDARQVVDVPLRTHEQYHAAKILQQQFELMNLSADLRNGPNAVTVYGCTVVDI